MNRMTELEPNTELMDALYWMKTNTEKQGFILTHYENGFLVEAIAENPVLADSYLNSNYKQKFMYKVEDSIFYSRKLNEAKKLFKIHKIRYILVDKNMKEGFVWSKKDEGLLFLFTSEKTFSKLYDKNDVQVWEVEDTEIVV